MHVFGRLDEYPPVADRAYTPREARLEDYRAVANRIGIDRVVVVQPSAYGVDNRCTLDAVRALGDNARAVVGLGLSVTQRELERLHAAGVRGVRLNFVSVGMRDTSAMVSAMTRTAGTIAELGWHVQLFVDLSRLGVLAPGIGTLPVDVVIDHMGLAKAALGARQPGIDTLLRLLAGGRCWVKLSGAYRVSAQRDGFDDAAVIARCLIAANPDRVIWGSDWPHTAPHPGKVTDSSPLIEFRDVDDAQLFDRLIQWTGDARTLSKVLVANPARLYGF